MATLSLPHIPFGSFSVDFDPLQADVLLQQGRGEEREILGYKPIQPLSGVVFSNGKFTHGIIRFFRCLVSSYLFFTGL